MEAYACPKPGGPLQHGWVLKGDQWVPLKYPSECIPGEFSKIEGGEVLQQSYVDTEDDTDESDTDESDDDF